MTTDEPMRTVAAQKVSRATPHILSEFGNVVSTFVIAGSSSTNGLRLTITNLQLTTPEPAAILIQPRQSDNRELGFPDEFAVQVIETHTDRILVRIKRVDGGGGWGQNLRLDLLIFDQINNP